MNDARQIARYAIERRLGSTGPTEAFRARLIGHGAAQEPVVIKRLQPRLATAENVKAFLDEARAAAWLDHPHIAQIYETDLDEAGIPFTVMEFVDGPTVAQIILLAAETGELPLTRLVAMFVGAAAALAHAHRALGPDAQPLGLVHGDVSTDNLRIGLDGLTKVLDFGQARFGAVTKSKVRHTAPELLRDPSARPTPAADVFGLGACLYLATTGAWPYAGITDEQIRSAVLAGRHRSPSELIPGFPPPLEAAICGALETDPQRRSSAADVAEALTAWLASTGESMTDAELGAWIRASFADRHHGTPIEQTEIDEPAPQAIVSVKAEPGEFFPFELPPPPPPPSLPPPPGVAGPTPLPFRAPPLPAHAPPYSDPFEDDFRDVGPTTADLEERTVVRDVSAADLDASGAGLDLGEQTAVREVSQADLAALGVTSPLDDPGEQTVVREVSQADLAALGVTSSLDEAGEQTAVREVSQADLAAAGASLADLGEQTAVREVSQADLAAAGASLGDLGEQTAVREVSQADLDAAGGSDVEAQTTVRPATRAELEAAGAPPSPEPSPTAPPSQPSGEFPIDVTMAGVQPASLEPPPRRPLRALALAAAVVALLGGLGGLAASWRAYRYRPLPPSEARLYIDTAQRAVLANNPALTQEMLDRARALPVLTSGEIIELATLEDATRFARLLSEAERALEAGDRRLALAKLEQIEKSLPNSPEAAALRRRVDGEPPPRVEPEPVPAEAPIAIAALEEEPVALPVVELAAPAPAPAKKAPPHGRPGTRTKADPKSNAARVEPAPPPEPVVAAPAVRAPARLEVSSALPAKVTLDGRSLGATPIGPLVVEPGAHVLVATAEGAEAITRSLTVPDGELTGVKLEFERKPPEPAAPAAEGSPAPREPSPDGPISQCPEGAELKGDTPPAGNALWCATPDGVRHGHFIRWNAKGKRAEEGDYVSGKKNGVWIEYFEDGTQRDRTSWRRGVKAW